MVVLQHYKNVAKAMLCMAAFVWLVCETLVKWFAEKVFA